MAATVSVEGIMNEIREDIQKKGYTKDQLSFEDFSAGATGLTRYGFDEKTALEILSDASRQWQLTSWKPLTGGKVKQGSGTGSSIKVEILYILIEVNKKKKFELDKLNFVFKVNGTDLLKKVRSQV